VDLRRAYEPEVRRTFYDGPLDPHAGFFAGPDGPYGSWHGIGLPLLLAPLAAVDPPLAVYRWFMMVIVGLLAYHLSQLARGLTRAGPVPILVGVVAVLVSPPVIYHANQVYPELIAGLLVVLAFRSLTSHRSLEARLAGASLAAVLLPWFNLRYVTLTAGLGLLVIACAFRARSSGGWRSGGAGLARALTLPAALALVSGGGLIAFNIAVYGAPVAKGDFSGYFQPANLYMYGAGGLIGFPSGLLPLAPVLVLAVVAVPRAARAIGPLPVAAAAGVALLYLGFNAYFGSPGFSLPGRYQVSVVPLAAIPLTAVLASGGLATIAAAALALSLTVVTVTTSAQYFYQLYTSDRRHIQPISATQLLWPIADSEVLHANVTTVVPDLAHRAAQVEEIEGSQYVVAREGRDPAGELAFIPHTRFPLGRYEAEADLWMAPPPRSGAPVRVAVVDQGSIPIAQTEVPFPDGESGKAIANVRFEVDGDGPVGVVISYPGEGAVGVRRMSVRLVEAFPFRRTEDEYWKTIAWTIGLAAIAVAWRRAPLDAGAPEAAPV
jgi:hypothetical protein